MYTAQVYKENHKAENLAGSKVILTFITVFLMGGVALSVLLFVTYLAG